MNKARILLVNDHELVALTKQSHPGTAWDSAEPDPDIVVLDISLPIRNIIDAVRQIARRLPQAKLLFLTTQDDIAGVRAAFDVGAVGYVLKTVSVQDLMRAIERVLAGELYLSPGVASGLPYLKEFEARIQLTLREREVLQLLSEGKQSKEIAHLLQLTVRTVSFHRENIKRKLGAKSTAELTRYAIGAGL